MMILHHQQEFIVVHKPVGMSVHNDPEHDVISLLSEELSAKVYAVHRLDRNTSGVLLCSTLPNMVSILQTQLAVGVKRYSAVVRGIVNHPMGEWKYPITDKAEGRRNPAGKKTNRKPSHTSFQTEKTNQYLSALTLTLHTGRQHQIRKHCVMAGHEIVGDTRYGDLRYQKNMKQRYEINGMLLHAEQLAFQFLGKDYSFSSRPQGWESIGVNPS